MRDSGLIVRGMRCSSLRRWALRVSGVAVVLRGVVVALLGAVGCTANVPRGPVEVEPVAGAAVSEAVVPVVVPVVVAPVKRVNSDGSLRVFPAAAVELPGRAHLYKYEDFGPQALAGQLLGAEWYVFSDCACFEPGDRFDIRVVVYGGGMSAAAVRRRYPSGPALGDYRVVRATEAIAFVREQLRDLESWADEDRIVSLEGTLRATRVRLEREFPEAARAVDRGRGRVTRGR
jgi:hypothetical protein